MYVDTFLAKSHENKSLLLWYPKNYAETAKCAPIQTTETQFEDSFRNILLWLRNIGQLS